MSYDFEASVECPVSKDFAWRFWTDVGNWAVVDSSIESVVLEGDFAAGTKGFTKPRGAEATEWRIIEVEDGESATIGIFLPGAVLEFRWKFADTIDGGTLISQRVTLSGKQAETYAQGMEILQKGIPEGMKSLAKGMAEAAKTTYD